MLLTILVPVFNGAKYLDSLLETLGDYAALEHGSRFLESVEIVVANNKSSDESGSRALAHKTRLPNLSVIEAIDHVPSAEENVFRSLKHCRGTYLWILGVDDVPVASSLPRLLDILETQTYDFLIFNNPIFNEKGRLTATTQFHMSETCYEDDIVPFAERFGIWYTLAGMSGEVIRKSAIERYDFDALIKQTSPIYAHVIAYLECFAKKRFVLVNFPIVLYRVQYRDISHWVKAAETMGVFDEYFWTLGLIRQLEYLERKGVISGSFMRLALDRNEFEFFRPAVVVLHKVLAQLRAMASGMDPRNRLTTNDFEVMSDFLLRKEPMTREVVWVYDDIFHLLSNGTTVPEATWRKAQELEEGYRTNYVLWRVFEASFRDYEIYNVGGRRFAVHRLYRPILVERLLYPGNEELMPFVVSGATLDELQAKIQTVISAPEYAGKLTEMSIRWTPERELTQMPRIKEALAEKEREAQELMVERDGIRSSLDGEATQLTRERDALRSRLDEVLRSTSWQITSPLRAVSRLRKRLLGSSK